MPKFTKGSLKTGGEGVRVGWPRAQRRDDARPRRRKGLVGVVDPLINISVVMG